MSKAKSLTKSFSPCKQMDIMKSLPSTSVTSVMTILSLDIRGCESITPRSIGEHKPFNLPIVPPSALFPLTRNGDVPMLQRQPSSLVVVKTPKFTSQNDSLIVLSLLVDGRITFNHPSFH